MGGHVIHTLINIDMNAKPIRRTMIKVREQPLLIIGVFNRVVFAIAESKEVDRVVANLDRRVGA